MKKILGLAALAALLLCSTPARAWNCTDPLASRVDVGSTLPAGATAGDGDGQYYKGSDAKNPNDYYVCQVPKPATPTTGSQTQNQTTSSASSSASNSSSTAIGGTSSATGGSASLSNSGNSSNKNTNTNVATGGAGGSSTATANGGAGGTANSSSSNNSTGSGNTTEVNSTYKEVHQVATALAPDVAVTAPCTKGFGVAGQSGFAGASFGASKVDKGCDDRETARYFATLLHNREAAALILCNTPAAKRAHLTSEQCLSSIPEPQPIIVQAPAPVASVQPTVIVPNVTVNIPAPAPVVQQVVAPVAPAAHYHRQLIGSCSLNTDGTLTCGYSNLPATGTILIVGTLEVDCAVAHSLNVAKNRLSIHAQDSGRVANIYIFVKD